MKKSYFFLSAAITALLLLLLLVILFLLIGFRFDTRSVEGYGRVSFWGKKGSGTVYLVGTTAEYDREKGSLAYENGDEYVGAIQNYLPNGQGRYVYHSGDVYEGEFRNGLPHGEGVYTFINCDSMMGFFEDGDFIKGKLTVYQKGSEQVIEGEFKKSNFSGNISYLFLDGAYYEGGYHNGLPDGTGKVTLPDGSRYEGAFKDGQFHGLGTYTFSNGDELYCRFEESKPNGRGVYTYTENGITKTVSGEFYDGYYLPNSES